MRKRVDKGKVDPMYNFHPQGVVCVLCFCGKESKTLILSPRERKGVGREREGRDGGSRRRKEKDAATLSYKKSSPQIDRRRERDAFTERLS